MADPTIIAPASSLSDFLRRLMRTVALRGIEIVPGAPGMARQTAPGRIVLWPQDGGFVEPGDKSVSIADSVQQFIAECWGKGTSSGAGNEPTFADWDATWRVMTLLLQGLAEQGENPTDPTSPGYFWELVAGPGFNRAQDTTQQGTSLQVLFSVRLPIAAASTDTGHVGDNWSSGTAESVDVDAPPYAPAP